MNVAQDDCGQKPTSAERIQPVADRRHAPASPTRTAADWTKPSWTAVPCRTRHGRVCPAKDVSYQGVGGGLSNEIIMEIIVVALCLAGGGILKGATGAGAPILAVPALAAFFDVRFAVVIMLVPNICTNTWQAVRFRHEMLGWRFTVPLLIGGVLGIGIGTVFLKVLSTDILSILVAVAVFGYVGLKLARPAWRMTMHWGERLAFPAGIAAGVLQGASGLSAPVSITFMNALGLKRETFISTISAFFATFTVIQFIAVVAGGLMRPAELLYSALALAPVSLAMPLGAAVGRRVSRETLDRVILAILAALAVKLFVQAVF